MTKTVYICDAIRTPIGKYAGSLAQVRPDDLLAMPIQYLMKHHPEIDWEQTDDVIMGCANQAGEDNRNVSRMSALLAGVPISVPGVTVNRLCGSGMEAIGQSARAIRAGEAHLILAGGVESMSRAPFVMGKSAEAFGRNAEIFDTTIGWRFINKNFKKLYGTDSMIETAENLAKEYQISRADQDLFAFKSQQKAAGAKLHGLFAAELMPVSIPQKKGDPILFSADEHPRLTPVDKLAELKAVTGEQGSVTAGNSSGVNDGAAALILASEEAVQRYGLKPKAKILGMQAAGVPPRIMGIGPVPATNLLLKRLGMTVDQMHIIELNEAFAAQSLACIRELKLEDDDPRINPYGGAIALGHPLGMSGARLVTTAYHQLQAAKARYALTTMCIGVGQGIAMVIENIDL